MILRYCPCSACVENFDDGSSVSCGCCEQTPLAMWASGVDRDWGVRLNSKDDVSKDTCSSQKRAGRVQGVVSRCREEATQKVMNSRDAHT